MREVGRLEVEPATARPVDPTERGADAVRVAERVADRQAHVGHAELGDRRPVGELGHRVHDRLRVHDDVDLVVDTPNSSWASITSRPLFISVLESIVILGPIDHVGCASASSTVTSASSSADRPRNGPPLAVSTMRADLAGRRRRSQALVDGAVLAVDGHELGAGRRPQRLHDRAGGDQALLVGEPETLAGAQRLDRDGEPGEPDDAVDHDVGRPRPGRPDRRPPRSPRRARPRPGPVPRSSATATTSGRNSRAWAIDSSTDDPTPSADDLVPVATLGADRRRASGCRSTRSTRRSATRTGAIGRLSRRRLTVQGSSTSVK